MHVSIEHHNDQFNVALASKEGKEPFLVIKGCRVRESAKGRFVSWPASKRDSGWWNHVYASEAFAAAVLDEYNKTAKKPAKPTQDDDSDIPF